MYEKRSDLAQKCTHERGKNSSDFIFAHFAPNRIMDFAEYQKKIKLATNLLTVVLLIVVVILETSLRFVAISHNCTFNDTDYVAHKMLVHTNNSEFTLRMLDNWVMLSCLNVFY